VQGSAGVPIGAAAKVRAPARLREIPRLRSRGARAG
jgi:hypothetical protein